MFDNIYRSVLLIEKTKPAWQKGLVNGIGGKIEPDDISDLSAMVREFREETGLITNDEDWDHFASLKGNDWEVIFFRSFQDRDFLCKAQSIEEEEVQLWEIAAALQSDVLMKNLKVLIPLALDNSGIAIPVILQDLS
jgi:8-oxo-dGTP diphosphatase